MDLKDIQNNTQGRNILKQVLIIIIQVGVLYVKFTELNLFLPKQPLSPTLKLQHIESISQEMTHFLHKLYYKKKTINIFHYYYFQIYKFFICYELWEMVTLIYSNIIKIQNILLQSPPLVRFALYHKNTIFSSYALKVI